MIPTPFEENSIIPIDFNEHKMGLKDSFELETVRRSVELRQWMLMNFLFMCMCEKAGSSTVHIPEGGCRKGKCSG